MPDDNNTKMVMNKWISVLFTASTVAISLALFALLLSIVANSARRDDFTSVDAKFFLDSVYNYQDAHNELPPQVVYSAENKTLYGWRVCLLPYVYTFPASSPISFDVSKPGDSNENTPFISLADRNIMATSTNKARVVAVTNGGLAKSGRICNSPGGLKVCSNVAIRMNCQTNDEILFVTTREFSYHWAAPIDYDPLIAKVKPDEKLGNLVPFCGDTWIFTARGNAYKVSHKCPASLFIDALRNNISGVGVEASLGDFILESIQSVDCS